MDSSSKKSLIPRLSVSWLIATSVLLLVTACDRPFVPPRVPEINIVQPSDPAALRFSPTLQIAVEATSFREIDRVEALGQSFSYDSTSNLWSGTVELVPGVSQVEITAYDIQDVASTETLNMTYIRPQFLPDAPTLPDPWQVGGHTATLLQDGSVLITGGAFALSQLAINRAFILRPGASVFEELENSLFRPRYGHSATLLPDGRVLLLGGGNAPSARNVSDLITQAEIYDPTTRQFTRITFEDPADPLLRMEHIAFVSSDAQSLIIDVYGGLGQNTQVPSDRLAIRGDIRSFRLIDNTLIPFSSFVSDQIQPSYGMSATPLTEQTTQNGRFVVSGATFLDSGPSNINFSVDFDASPIRVTSLENLAIPRLQHASEMLAPGLTAIFGGFQGSAQSATNSTEIFVELNERFTRIDSRVSTRRRFSHTATKLPSGRILILGGFSESGEGIRESEFFVWSE